MLGFVGTLPMSESQINDRSVSVGYSHEGKTNVSKTSFNNALKKKKKKTEQEKKRKKQNKTRCRPVLKPL